MGEWVRQENIGIQKLQIVKAFISVVFFVAALNILFQAHNVFWYEFLIPF